MKLLLDQVASPIGTVLLVSDGEALRALDFADCESRMRDLLRLQYGASYSLTPSGAVGALRRAIAAYFEGDLAVLDHVRVELGGTDFQRLVWTALRQIPAGTTTSYGRLAARIGRPSASRAVGLANGSNPVAIVVPCHRVIGADRSLTGYGGGLARKQWLIDHERRHIQQPAAADADPAGQTQIFA